MPWALTKNPGTVGLREVEEELPIEETVLLPTGRFGYEAADQEIGRHQQRKAFVRTG
jgi:hypothetical protein